MTRSTLLLAAAVVVATPINLATMAYRSGRDMPPGVFTVEDKNGVSRLMFRADENGESFEIRNAEGQGTFWVVNDARGVPGFGFRSAQGEFRVVQMDEFITISANGAKGSFRLSLSEVGSTMHLSSQASNGGFVQLFSDPYSAGLVTKAKSGTLYLRTNSSQESFDSGWAVYEAPKPTTKEDDNK